MKKPVSPKEHYNAVRLLFDIFKKRMSKEDQRTIEKQLEEMRKRLDN